MVLPFYLLFILVKVCSIIIIVIQQLLLPNRPNAICSVHVFAILSSDECVSLVNLLGPDYWVRIEEVYTVQGVLGIFMAEDKLRSFQYKLKGSKMLCYLGAQE